jgi:hypothetical protein
MSILNISTLYCKATTDLRGRIQHPLVAFFACLRWAIAMKPQLLRVSMQSQFPVTLLHLTAACCRQTVGEPSDARTRYWCRISSTY